ncbi:MAG: FAD-dependent oxidoreductase [Chloroflexi bacterium]|nr:FAD-dependent oxidoreductase [Chloroflexota bacterium]
MKASRSYEVVIVGAGVAGMAAAMRLRDRDILVLEAEPEVGGRTWSKGWHSTWVNYGAEAITRDDMVRITALAQELECTLTPRAPYQSNWGYHAPVGVSREAAAVIDEFEERLKQEAADPRDPTLPELDDRTLEEFLSSPVRDAVQPDDPTVREFLRQPGREARQWVANRIARTKEATRWIEYMMGGQVFGAAADVSLFGALVLFGKQRTSPWSTEEVPRNGIGPRNIEGGMQQVALRAAEVVGRERVLCGAPVLSVEPMATGPVTVTYRRGDVTHTIAARQVIVATPAPVAHSLIPSLPAEKQAALGAVTYGCLLSTPVFLVARGEVLKGPPRLTYCRPGVDYVHPMHRAFRIEVQDEACCIRTYLFGAYAQPVWNDPDHTIQTGVIRDLYEAFPELVGRVHHVEVKRWQCGIPRIFPGRMKLLPRLLEPYRGVHFAGDYVAPLAPHTDGAVRSGERAAAEVRAALQ